MKFNDNINPKSAKSKKPQPKWVGTVAKALRPLPLGLFAAIAVCSLLLAPVLFSYAVAMTVAAPRPMVFLFVFGLTALSLALCLISTAGFFWYKRKFGFTLSLKRGKTADNEKDGVKKTVLAEPQNAAQAANEQNGKKKLTPMSLCTLICAVLGAGSIMISAILGCTEAYKWTNAFWHFRTENGYYGETQLVNLQYNSVSNITVDTSQFECTVVYTDDAPRITLRYRAQFEDQLTANLSNGVLEISEKEKTDKTALENMLFFITSPSQNERALVVFIPTSLKDTITISGDYCVR